MRPAALNRLRLAPEQLALFCGRHVYVANRYGQIESGMDGLYHEQTRFLSRQVLSVNGHGVKPVCANAVSHCTGIAYFLAPSPMGAAAGPPGQDPADKGGEVVEKGIEIQVNTYGGGGARQDVIVTNRTLKAVTVTLEWAMDADFADLDEVISGERRQTAPVRRHWAAGEAGQGTLTFTYEQPRLHHATRVAFTGETARFVDKVTSVQATVTLHPQRAEVIGLDIAPTFLGEELHPWHGLDGAVTTHHPDADHASRWLEGCARLETDSAPVQSAWNQAVSDLAALHTLTGEGDSRFTPMAGIPKYTALFGRDTLVAGLQSVLLTPTTINGALTRLGEWTATRTDDAQDAQPGKVLHQHQMSPLAVLGLNPFRQYYGDYSAPGLYILGAAAHFAHTGDRAAFAAIRPLVFATLDWMDRDGDLDGDGFYEYQTRAGRNGIKNQGWKDSGQAILHADGSFVDNPIAVTEVQGLYYAAKQALAGVLACLGENGRAADLMAQAATLKRQFNERFWMPDLGYLALGLGPDKAQIRTIASDPGSSLSYGIVDPDKARAVAARIMQPDMFSGWGIRTLSSAHPAYNPLAYHLGSVWPVATANIVYGLSRHGFTAACQTLAEGFFDSTGLFDYDRLPEVFGGHPRDRRHPHPGIYPDACSPQAWSATAVMHVVRALCGVTPLAPLDAVVIDPILPAWLPRLTLRDVQVGERRVSITLRREADGTTSHEVRGGTGLRIIRPGPTPEGEDRVAAAFAAAIG